MAKQYFDNAAVTKSIREYQKTLRKGTDDLSIMHKHTDELQNLVRGVINTHKIYRWWPDVDELIQEGMLAIFSSFRRFNPKKGTAFNYLSIVAKQHLKNWTQDKNKKTWVTSELNEEIYQDAEQIHTQDNMDLADLFYSVEVPTELEQILESMVQLLVVERIHNKRDIVRSLVQQGNKKQDVSKLFKILSKQFTGFTYDR